MPNTTFDDINLDAVSDSPAILDLIRSVEESNARFRDLPHQQKVLAATIVLSGKTDIIPNLWRLFYRRQIPPISDFLGADYLGDNALFYPKDPNRPGYVWRKELEEIFAPGSACWFLVASGAIGTAKTSACTVGHFYNLYRITSLLRPQLSMGSAPQKPMNLQFMSVTREKASNTLMKPVLSLLQGCKYFFQVQNPSEFQEVLQESEGAIVPFSVTSGPESSIHFPDNVGIYFGSREHHAVGEDLFGASLDEAESRVVGKGAENTINLFFELVERIRSRFLTSPFKFATLISSIGEESGVMAKMIKNIKPDDPYRRVARYSIWEVRFPQEMTKGHFYVLRGTRTFPSRVLDADEGRQVESGNYMIPTGCRVIKVPESYRFDFEMRVNNALRNLAGVSTSSDDYPFGLIEHCIDLMLPPEIELEVNIGDTQAILDMLPKEMFLYTPDGPRLRRFPYARRYIHVDLAVSGVAAITCVHKERSAANDILYVVDFTLRIVTSSHIAYESINAFIQDLRRKVGINIHTFTADSFQSESLLQFVKVRKLAENVRILSVDRTLNAYAALLEVVNERCFRIGRCPRVAEELKTVYFSGDKPLAEGRKDSSDTLAGSCYNAIMNPTDIPVNVYDNFSADGKSAIPGDFVPMAL